MIALEAKEQKYNLESHKKRLETIIDKWDEIQNIISEELPTVNETIALFDKVGLPKTMGELGISEEILPLTFKSAKDIRNKYVLPRLCWDLGIIDDII
jgi:glycerol-1-phosphate dehydrogenase [NAD(P)+]